LTHDPQNAVPAPGDFKPYDRIVVLALDSLTWDVVKPLLDDGVMPRLAAFLKRAHAGTLNSTIPPHTAAAWSTFLTGQEPGRHGVLDFIHYDPVKQRTAFQDSSATRPNSFLTRLSAAGISCGSIFLPRSYPPYPLQNGYMVSGFETPGTGVRFAEPPDLRDEILRSAPGMHFNFEDDWNRDPDPAVFAANIDRAIEAVDLLETLSLKCQRERPVRVQVSYLQAPDILFHKAWRWCDPILGPADPFRRKQILRFFERVDLLVERVFGLNGAASPEDRTLRVIVSDHGHGISSGRVFMNTLLQEWGWLTPLGRLRRAAKKLETLALSQSERRARRWEPPIDWNSTRAYVSHVAMYGFVYLNLKGREPQGIVPAQDFEKVRDDLIARFRAEKVPGSDTPLFPQVLKGEDVFERKAELNLPDLVVVPIDGYFPRKKLTRKAAVRSYPNAVGGIHRTNGVFALEGPGVAPRFDIANVANISDLAPTLLAALGQPVPTAMTGTPLSAAFAETLPIQRVEDDGTISQAPAAHVYSAEEEQAIEKRLSDLGYLE
jgi:predicted AlkP superfamily phosphohydrolase/phosphomutase